MRTDDHNLPQEIRDDPDYAYARSCEHSHDTADGENRYVSTYCGLKHVHLLGFRPQGPFPCYGCQDYSARPDGPALPATTKDIQCLRNRTRYEQPMEGSSRRHVLWYGGDVLSVKKDGFVLTLRANGDVIAEYRDGDKHISVRDKSCHGVFAEKLREHITDDTDLLALIAAGDNSTAPRALEITDNNWWEVFVTKDGFETGSTVLDSENYDEALTEMLELLPELTKEGK